MRLVRNGVAPDSFSIKRNGYEKFAAEENLNTQLAAVVRLVGKFAQG
jgi:hypothetical protein